MDIKRIVENKELFNIISPSGSEDAYAEYIKNNIENYVDKIYIDNLGNLIAKKNGGSQKTILLTAHIDEASVVVTSIEDNGFLNFSVTGNINPYNLISQKIIFASGTRGVIMPQGSNNADYAKITANDLFIDIGAQDSIKAQEIVDIGEAGVFEHKIDINGDIICGSALDNKLPVMMLMELVKSNVLSEYTLFFAFAVQKHKSSRGAKSIAFSLESDISIDIDVTSCCDIPGGKNITSLGGGACIKVKDSAMIARKSTVKLFKDIARGFDMPFQIEISDMPISGAARLQQSKDGGAAIGLSIPTRYLGSANECMNINDINDILKLITNIKI